MTAIILYQPEIPPNTGNIIRLCANTGCELHLIEPLGFDLSDKQLRRAGLDYHEYAKVTRHGDWQGCLAAMAGRRLFALSTRGGQRYDTVQYRQDDAFVFGRETAGFPEEILAQFAPERRLRLPMQPGQRSLNLSNATAVMAFEVWRQLDFAGGG